MLNLDEAIAEWRRRMTAAGVKNPEVLDELESHLREDVEQQVRSGAFTEAAVEAAVRRLGQASALREEFQKMLPAGLLVPRRYLSIFCFVCAPFMLMISFWALLTDEIGAVERGCGLATISAMMLYMCGLPRLHRHLPSPGRRLVRAALLLGNLLFMGWPLVLLSISLGIVPLRLGITVEMMIGAAYVAGFATWLGYAVQGQSALTGSGNEAVACE